MRWSIALLMSMTAVPALGGTVDALVLDYREWEPGAQPYVARVLVTPDYMRQDYGSGETADAGFVLLDRRAGVIYSVQTSDRRILEVQAGGALPTPPDGLELTQQSRPQPDAPPVAGQQPLFTAYLVDGKTCYRTVSVPGLLPDAVAAWSEFRRIMATQQAATLHHTPLAMRDTCQLVNDIYAPLRPLQQGLPIREHNPAGLSRELTGYQSDQAVDEGLFQLPDGYEYFRIEAAGD